jgi:hypothetical protein
MPTSTAKGEENLGLTPNKVSKMPTAFPVSWPEPFVVFGFVRKPVEDLEVFREI